MKHHSVRYRHNCNSRWCASLVLRLIIAVAIVAPVVAVPIPPTPGLRSANAAGNWTLEIDRYPVLWGSTSEFDVTANDTNVPANGVLSITAADVGTASIVPSTRRIRYIAPANYTGYATFRYSITSAGQIQSAQVIIGVLSSLRPATKPDTYFTPKDTSLEVLTPGVQANDSIEISFKSFIATPPAHGTVTLATDGSFTYVPAAGFSGVDSFTYRLVSLGDFWTEETVRIGVGRAIAVPDRYLTPSGEPLVIAGPGVIANDQARPDSVPGDLDLTGLRGQLTMDDSGGFTFTPDADFQGETSFTYLLKSGDGRLIERSNRVTVTIGVADRTAVVATNDSYVADYDASLNAGTNLVSGNVLANDRSPFPLNARITANVTRGEVQFSPNGDFVYEPAGFGAITFRYRADNQYGGSAEATVTITTLPPLAVKTATYRTPAGAALTVPAPNLLRNAYSGVRVMSATFTTTLGDLVVSYEGGFTYTPKPASRGTETVSITIIDNYGRTASGQLTFEILSPTPTPTRTPLPSATPTKTPTQVVPTATTPPGVPAVSLSRIRTTVNTPVQFTISGFAPNADVTIKWKRLTGTVFDLLTVRTNGTGSASGEFRVPATPGGAGQEVRFVQGAVTKVVSFEVVARIKVSPDPAQRGQLLDISLRGYARGETVRIRWLRDGRFVEIGSVVTSNTGSANLRIPAPGFAADGEHSVRGDGTVFRQQTNTVTIAGGPPVTLSVQATPSPTATPTATATPSLAPSSTATPAPTLPSTPEPVVTVEPSPEATLEPTVEPTIEPTQPASPEPSPELTPASQPELTPESSLEEMVPADPSLSPSPDVDLTSSAAEEVVVADTQYWPQ